MDGGDRRIRCSCSASEAAVLRWISDDGSGVASCGLRTLGNNDDGPKRLLCDAPVRKGVFDDVLIDVKRRDGVQSRATWWERELWRNVRAAWPTRNPSVSNGALGPGTGRIETAAPTLCRQNDRVRRCCIQQPVKGTACQPTLKAVRGFPTKSKKSDCRWPGFGS
jgi:hypothetical protein